MQEFHSDINKNTEIMPFAATWMDLEVIILSEVCQTEKENITRYCLYVASEKKMIQINLYTKTEIDPQTQKANLQFKGKGWSSDKLGVWD